VLGMLVGRTQGQHGAETAAASTAAKAAAINAPFESVETGKMTVEPAPEPAKADPSVADPPIVVAEPKPEPKPPKEKTAAPPAPPGASAPTPVKMIYLQVDALEKETAANKELDDLRKQGFSAVLIKGEGANKLFRVQVGPFSYAADAETAKRKLESLGYKPIRK